MVKLLPKLHKNTITLVQWPHFEQQILPLADRETTCRIHVRFITGFGPFSHSQRSRCSVSESTSLETTRSWDSPCWTRLWQRTDILLHKHVTLEKVADIYGSYETLYYPLMFWRRTFVEFYIDLWTESFPNQLTICNSPPIVNNKFLTYLH